MVPLLLPLAPSIMTLLTHTSLDRQTLPRAGYNKSVNTLFLFAPTCAELREV